MRKPERFDPGLDLWRRLASSNAKKRRKSRALKDAWDRVWEIREWREKHRPAFSAEIHPYGGYTPQDRLLHKRAAEAEERAHAEYYAAKAEEKARLDGIRATLKAFARAGRRLPDATVTSSRGRGGRVSSYYIRLHDGEYRPIRISDHELPDTPQRQANREYYGASPFRAEILVDRPMTATRIRRLLALAIAGRAQPWFT